MSWNPDKSAIPNTPGQRIRIRYPDGFCITTVVTLRPDGTHGLAFCDRRSRAPRRCFAAVDGWYALSQDSALGRREGRNT